MTHTTDKYDGKKDKILQELLVAEYETDGSKKFTGWRFRTLVSCDKISTSREIELIALQEAHKVRNRASELEVEAISTRNTEIRQNSPVLKTRSSLTPPSGCIKRKFWCKKQWPQVNLIILISGSSGKSRFAKDGKEELTSLTARVSIQFIPLQRQRWKRHMIYWLESIAKAKCMTILMTSMQHLIPGSS